MIMFKVNIDKIKYNYCEYSDDLFESVKRISISIPVKVNKIHDDLYEVIDGNKRCSIIKDINDENMVYITVVNDHSCAGSSNWSSKNTH